jgi:acyl-CoA thioester hydrolase
MSKLTAPIHIRWADIDANRHLRHSVYYDFAAAARMQFLKDGGLTTEKLEEFQIGPILFREEAIFRREIKLEDQIVLDIHLVKASEDFGRWGLRHHFLKPDGTVATILNVEGAWIDLLKRKLTLPNSFIKSIFESFPKSEDFEWIPFKTK